MELDQRCGGSQFTSHLDNQYAERWPARQGSSLVHDAPMAEAEMKTTEKGLVPQGEGWFVLNAREASWIHSEARGQDTDFEGGQEWSQLGFRIHVLMPGQRNGMYHRERGQEDFLVVAGECVLVIEGQDRRAVGGGHVPHSAGAAPS